MNNFETLILRTQKAYSVCRITVSVYTPTHRDWLFCGSRYFIFVHQSKKEVTGALITSLVELFIGIVRSE